MVKNLLLVGPDDEVMTQRRQLEVFGQLQAAVGATGAGRQDFDDNDRIVGSDRIPVEWPALHNRIGFVVAVSDGNRYAIRQRFARRSGNVDCLISERQIRALTRACPTRSGGIPLAPSRATTVPWIRSKRPRGCASTQAWYSSRVIGSTGVRRLQRCGS